jgi:hypothetical protein
VWGVTKSALSRLVPGGALTLTASTSGSDPYYLPDWSAISWPLRTGATLYAQVDSYNPSTTYGTVRETHELLGEAYNNIRGPIRSTAGATAETMSLTTSSFEEHRREGAAAAHKILPQTDFAPQRSRRSPTP